MAALVHVRERTGEAIGRLVAPLVAVTTEARHARTFHPDGVVCTGQVEAVAGSPFARLAARLEGRVLARFSAALWKGRPRWFDVLGIALRFGDDQDLLFATIRSPFTMPVAPLFTNTRSFLGNRYWAVSPFEVADEGRLKFRLVPPRGADPAWTLEARRVFRLRYRPVVRLAFDRVDRGFDQSALRFDPFRSGRGIVPSGLVHAIRRAVYRSGQAHR